MYDAEKFIQILESYRPKMCSDDLVTYILSCYLLVCSVFYMRSNLTSTIYIFEIV